MKLHRRCCARFQAHAGAAVAACLAVTTGSHASILWRQPSTGNNYVWLMDGAVKLPESGTTNTISPSWVAAGTGDFNGDGHTDVLWRNLGDGTNWLWLMDERTVLPQSGYLPTLANRHWTVAGTGDFDGDGNTDILWRHGLKGRNSLWLMDGTTVRPESGPLPSLKDLDWTVAGTGDFDGDGNTDVLWRHLGDGRNSMWLLDGTTILPGSGPLPTLASRKWVVAATADFDADGRSDLLWRHVRKGKNSLWFMDGTTILPGSGALPVVDEPGWVIAGAADFDDDGYADILWRDLETGDNLIWFMEGTSRDPVPVQISALDPTWTVIGTSDSNLPPVGSNLPPAANAGPDKTATAGMAVSLNGSGSFDPDGWIVSYSWDFGDGGSASGAAVSHTYAAPGDYVVTLTVRDNEGLTDSDIAQVTVTEAANLPPQADAGPDKTATAGMAVSLSGSGSFDPDGWIVSYSWDFGDGGSASGATVSHTYAAPGDYVVTLTVRDNEGLTDSDIAQVTVTAASSGGGEFRWARHFGNTDMDYGRAVATDSSGNVLVTGRVVGAVDLGGGGACTESIFLAKYTAEGDHLWSQCFGGLGSGSGLALATDSDDNVFMTGYFTGTVDFGGWWLTSAGGADVFVAKYTESGDLLWAKRFGSPTLGAFIKESGNAIAADPSGNVVVTGFFEGTADFGGTPLTSAGQTDIFVARYSAGGQHLWSKSFGDRGSLDSGNAVATDGSGNVLVAGSFAGSVNFGGGPLTGAGSTIFVVKYSPSGTHRWSQSFGGSNSDAARSIAVDGSGDVIVAGNFEGAVDFGGGPLTSAGEADIFVAKYSSAGAHRWSHQFGSAGNDDAGNAVAVDDSGNVVLAGFFMGTVDFGGGPLVGATSTEIFVAKYTPSGAHLWSTRFGARSVQEANAVALSDTSVFVSGVFARTVDFGGGVLQSAGGTDVFVLCLEP